jgi:hypothetical protein
MPSTCEDPESVIACSMAVDSENASEPVEDTPEAARLVSEWANLPAHIRQAILTLIRGAE